MKLNAKHERDLTSVVKTSQDTNSDSSLQTSSSNPQPSPGDGVWSVKVGESAQPPPQLLIWSSYPPLWNLG